MPVSISVKDKRILLTIQKGSPNFMVVVDALKMLHCSYDPDTHEWEIAPARFERVHDILSDIERIIISEQDEKEIDALMTLPTQIKIFPYEGTIFAPKLPPIQGKSPYEDYQTQDIWTLYHTNRFALFNEQGTGKSYELISTIDLLRRQRGIKKVLFITSASGVYNIKREFGRFSDITSIAVGGIKNRRPFDDPGVNVVLMNYRSFLLVSDEYQKDRDRDIKNYRTTPIPIMAWLAGDQGILVLDESHNIANPKARQTKAIQLISPFFEYRYLATGTPADKEEKYYSQLRILDPALVRGLPYNDWLGEYFNIGNRYSAYAINGIKPNKARELSELVAKHCVRRFADDVLSLPQQYTRKYYVEFSDIQRRIYQSVVKERMTAIQQEFGNLNSRAVVNSFPYLILAIDNPELLLRHADRINTSMINEWNFRRDHPKIEALLDILDNHPNEKVVIWTSHPSVAYILSGLLKNCLVINGETPVPKGMTLDQLKDSVVDKFLHEPECRILIASQQVMNSSITLVAANIQIVFDSTFNYTEYDQALSRIHRIGQDRPVHTYVLLIDESLDVMRHMNLEQKNFVNTKFLTKEYIDLHTAKNIFNMRGE